MSRGESFLRVFVFFLVSIIPQMLLSHLLLHVALIRRTNVGRLWTFLRVILLRKLMYMGYKINFNNNNNNNNNYYYYYYLLQ